MAKQMRSLKAGDKVEGYFHGDKNGDGSIYSLPLTFVNLGEDGERANFNHNGETFEVYKFGNRWSYGSGAHRFSFTQ